MTFQSLSNLYQSISGARGKKEIPEGFVYYDLVTEFKKSITNHLKPGVQVLNSSSLVSADLENELRAKIKASGKDHLNVTVPTAVTFKVTTENSPIRLNSLYPIFFSELSKKVSEQYPELLIQKEKDLVNRSSILISDLQSGKWFVEQSLRHVDKPSHFDLLVSTELLNKAKNQFPDENKFDNIISGLRDFFDKYLSGLMIPKYIKIRWSEAKSSQMDTTSINPYYSKAIPTLRDPLNDTLYSALDIIETPHSIPEVHFPLSMYICDKEINTYREAIHLSRAIYRSDNSRKIAGAIIPLFLYLIYNSIRGDTTSKTSVSISIHIPFLKIIVALIGNDKFDPDIASSYHKRYTDAGSNFKKYINKLNSKEPSIKRLISEIKSNFEKINLSNHSKFTDLYLKLINRKPDLRHNTTLEIRRSPSSKN